MDRAEAQKALQACIADEQTYQFTSFSHRDAWELGHALVDACEKMGAPLAVEIEINHVIVFRYYPDVLRAGGQLRGSGTRLAAAAQ